MRLPSPLPLRLMPPRMHLLATPLPVMLSLLMPEPDTYEDFLVFLFGCPFFLGKSNFRTISF